MCVPYVPSHIVPHCRTAVLQVVLLLKSSDRVAHDVSLLAAAHEAAAATTQAAPAGAAAAGAQAATPGSEGAGGAPHLEERGSISAKQQEQQQQQPQEHSQGEAAGAAGVPVHSPGSGGVGGTRGASDQGVAGPADSGRGSEAPCGDSPAEPGVLAPVLVLKKWCNLRAEREFRRVGWAGVSLGRVCRGTAVGSWVRCGVVAGWAVVCYMR